MSSMVGVPLSHSLGGWEEVWGLQSWPEGCLPRTTSGWLWEGTLLKGSYYGEPTLSLMTSCLSGKVEEQRTPTERTCPMAGFPVLSPDHSGGLRATRPKSHSCPLTH